MPMFKMKSADVFSETSADFFEESLCIKSGLKSDLASSIFLYQIVSEALST